MIIEPSKEIYEKYPTGSDKKVTLKCDECGHINTTTYNNYYNSQRKKGFSGITNCRKCTSSKGAKSRFVGKIPWNKGQTFPEKSGENSPTWNGGTYIDASGYRMIYVGGRKDEIGWNSYRKEHMLVMEKSLGRPLKPNEIIHHIDGNKLNNNIDNLLLLNGNKEHRDMHAKLQRVAYRLIISGYIVFDKKDMTYKLKDE